MASRDLAKKLDGYGFERLDKNTGSGHQVWRHPRAGTMIVPSTPSDHRSYQNTLAQARRMVRLLDSNVGAFLTYMRLTYSVPRRGYKDFTLNLSDEIRNWMEREHVSGITEGGLSQGVKLSTFYEPLANRRGARTSMFRLYGRDYALADEPDLVEAELPIREQSDDEPVPAEMNGHAEEPVTLTNLRAMIEAAQDGELSENRATFDLLIEAHTAVEQRLASIQADLDGAISALGDLGGLIPGREAALAVAEVGQQES